MIFGDRLLFWVAIVPCCAIGLLSLFAGNLRHVILSFTWLVFILTLMWLCRDDGEPPGSGPHKISGHSCCGARKIRRFRASACPS